ncbi:membrane protein involved in aromatic hydrocarbon degradation [Roseibium sp. TrichSKD4]|uniref:OmpP1/FadL family transporter n=1 Tax=Roseibium sp. TrichSKD4 TaxID=744980 RepID=UPI0001E574B0|nr:OmpP1/FadL family transporter [Roseibium sp. TrichSKD4]EFO30823.1 membrane protein involved in aromatic hydrocarbon degradation [Roseibium sp. TrichSKD4]
MLRFNKNTILLASTAVAAIMVAETATAGGFALREQSSYYQGMSFAGNATSGPSISSMFWNPAAITGAKDGLTVEAHNSLIVPNSDVSGTFTPGTMATINGYSSSTVPGGDIGLDAWIPASYAAYRLNDQLVFGIGINAPYGLSTKPKSSNWAGQLYSRSSEVFSVNVNPTIAYQVNDMISFGLGLQVQYIHVRLKGGYVFSTTGQSSEVKGDDIGFGVTAGLTFKPFQGTEIGLGFRSTVSHDLEGSFANPSGRVFVAGTGLVNFGASKVDVTGSVNMPETVTLSAKQDITDDLRVLGTVEWANWSRIGTIHLSSDQTTTNPTDVPDLEFNYEDGWFFALGAEYDWSDHLTLRAGAAYELSPIDTDIRSTRLPDNDRIWLSAGFSYQPMENLSLDLGYSYIFIQDTDIKIVDGHQDYRSAIGTFVGEADANVNILSASMRYTF